MYVQHDQSVAVSQKPAYFKSTVVNSQNKKIQLIKKTLRASHVLHKKICRVDYFPVKMLPSSIAHNR